MKARIISYFFLVFFLFSCHNDTEYIRVCKNNCTGMIVEIDEQYYHIQYLKSTHSNNRWLTEIITTTGQHYKFNTSEQPQIEYQ